MARIAYHLPGGGSFWPDEIILFLTYRCNLRCQMCGQWRQNGYVRRGPDDMLCNELQLDKLKSFLDEVAHFKPTITLCGGEVLLYKGWDSLIYYAHSHGLRCQMITNGQLLESAADRIVEAGTDLVVISIDGPPDIHDKVRGVQGAFGRALAGVSALKGARKNRRPKVWLNTTISALNHSRLREMLTIASDAGSDALFFQHLYFVRPSEMDAQNKVFVSRFGCRSTDWEGYVFEPEGLDPERLAEEIEFIKTANVLPQVGFIPNFSRKQILNYYGKKTSSAMKLSGACRGPWRSVYVLPNGDVSPCSSFVAGNLMTENFARIWNGQRFKFFRTTLREIGGSFPVCRRCCIFYRY